ncbi:MAG: glutathione binding-like protein [Polyangiales bacterium]
MELYFSPLSCALATRIALYECGGEHSFIEVSGPSGGKRLPDGSDYRALNPLGQVPMLRDGSLWLTENSAILQYVARKHGALMPRDEAGLTELQRWLSFVGTELHKTVFNPLLDASASDEVKRYALGKSEPRLALLAAHLRERDYLLAEFSVADAYLTAVLGWVPATPVSLEPWPALRAYLERVRARPAVRKAIGEERELYRREQSRT